MDSFEAALEKKAGSTLEATPLPTPPPAVDPFEAALAAKAGTSSAIPGAAPQTLLGGFSSGIQRGIKNDAALVKGAIGVGLSGLGLESGNEWLDAAIADQQRAETAIPRAVPSFSDIGGVHDAAMYASETLGENLPTLLGLVASGGVGGAALKYGGRKLVEKGIENRLTKLMIERGVEASTLAGATGLETGASGVEQKQAVGKVNVPLALGAGAVKGALESLTPMALGRTLGISDDLAKGLVSNVAGALQGAGRSRILKAIGAGAVTEGATETLQEAVDIAVRGYVDKNYNALGPEAAERLLNAGIGGALVGGVAAGGVSGLAGEVAPDAPVTIEQLRETAARPARVDKTLPQATIADVEPLASTYTVEKAAAGTGMPEIELAGKPNVPENEPTNYQGIPYSELRAQMGSTTTEVPAAANTNAATPGSDPRDQQLGFDLLPTAYKGIPARDEVDLVRAPLELAVQRLTAERTNLELQEKVVGKKGPKGPSEPTVAAASAEGTLSPASRQRDAAINSLLAAGAYARKDRVPTILEGVTEGNTLVGNIPEMAVVTQQLPQGFQVQPAGGGIMLNLKSPEGRTIVQVPNKEWALPLLQSVASADRELWTSGFYNVAAGNITKMREMGLHDVIDTRTINTLPIKDTLNVVRKLGYHKIGPAANLNIIPAKAPKVGVNQNSLEADTIKFSKFASMWNTLLQIAQKNPDYAPLTQGYVGSVQSEEARAMHITSAANDTVKLGQRIGREQLNAASDFLWDLEQQVYKDPEDADRWPTETEEATLITKHGIRRETYRFITQMREQVAAHFNMYAEQMQQEALLIQAKEGTNQLEAMRQRSDQLKNIEQMKKSFFSRPRFPFTNIGDFLVEVREGGEVVAARLVETRSDQVATFKEFQRQYPESQGYKLKQSKIPLNMKQWVTAPDMTLRALMESGVLGNLSKEQRQVAMFLSRTNPGMKRRFIHGASPRYGQGVDLLRAFATYSSSTASNLFKMRVTPKLTFALAQMDRDRRAMTTTNNLGDLITFLNEHMKDLLNPTSDATRFRSLAFLWHISFVPASALLNATQVPLTTLPYLGSRFGNVKAMLAIQKAYTSFNTFYSAGKLETMTDARSRMQARAIRDAITDQSFATEIAGLAEGGNLSRMLPGTKFDRTLANFSYYGGFMFQLVEKMNRNVTFNAAVDLALAAKGDSKYLTQLAGQNTQTFNELLAEGFTEKEAKAFLAGRDAVTRTQFEYSRWNRPKFMKGKIKGTIFTFWLFTQGMLHFGRNSPGALKYWFIMLATAGLMGLPGAEDAKDIIRAASQWWFGTDFDAELEARRYIATLVNPWLDEKGVPGLMKSLGLEGGNLQVSADLFLHGISQDSFGLANAAETVGVPYVPHIDMSGALSMGKLAPIDMTMFRPGLDWNTRVSKTVERLAGAAVGPSVGMLNGLFDPKLPGDDFKVWEKAMPRIMRGFLKAGRLGTEGEERTRTGSPVLQFDPMDPMHNAELWMMAAGFQPTRLTRAWDKEIAKREAVQYWDARREILLNQLDHARYMHDQLGIKDMKQAILRFNKAVPWNTKRITADTMQKSMKARQAKRRAAAQGLPDTKSDRPAYREIEALYQ